jgi:diphthamide biosynthesis enzyme Dph1/Dph2-like protein
MIDLELNKIADDINNRGCKRVVIQLPDGLKPKARTIVEHLRENTDAEVILWLGSCFGGCDIPLGLEELGVDLLIQFGHNRFEKVEL